LIELYQNIAGSSSFETETHYCHNENNAAG